MTARKLEWFTSVGSYPLFYLDTRDSVLCPHCAQQDVDEGKKVTEGINWEDGCLHCDQCSVRIPSAYAEEGS